MSVKQHENGWLKVRSTAKGWKIHCDPIRRKPISNACMARRLNPLQVTILGSCENAAGDFETIHYAERPADEIVGGKSGAN